MGNMNKNQFKSWSKHRSKGVYRFLFVYGFLIGGSIYFTVLHLFLDSDRVAFFNASIESQLHKVIGSSLFGVIFAFASWFKSERAFKDYIATEDKST